MKEVEGWCLPDCDKYFGQFLARDATVIEAKANGFERDHLLAALKYVSNFDVALDIGAHVGFWTRDLAARFGKVHAFEPAVDTFPCLEVNTADLLNVVRYPYAVGNEIGKCVVTHDPKRERMGNTGSRYVRPSEYGNVRMLTIDSLELPLLDFIKLDVEGFELQALHGGEHTIRANYPPIIMECDKRFEARYNVPFGEAERTLRKWGYKIVEQLGRDKIFVHGRQKP